MQAFKCKVMHTFKYKVEFLVGLDKFESPDDAFHRLLDWCQDVLPDGCSIDRGYGFWEGKAEEHGKVTLIDAKLPHVAFLKCVARSIRDAMEQDAVMVLVTELDKGFLV